MTDRNSPARTSPLPLGASPDPAFEAAVLRALETLTAPGAPEGFAARVAQQASATHRPRAHFGQGWGPRIALGSVALLTAGLFALAPHAAPSLRSWPFDAELLLLGELGALLLFPQRLLFPD